MVSGKNSGVIEWYVRCVTTKGVLLVVLLWYVRGFVSGVIEWYVRGVTTKGVLFITFIRTY